MEVKGILPEADEIKDRKDRGDFLGKEQEQCESGTHKPCRIK